MRRNPITEGAEDLKHDDGPPVVDEKESYTKGDIESVTDEAGSDDSEVLRDARDLVTHVISLDDDSSLSPWTFRVFVIGLGLSTFGGVLGMSA